MKYEVGKTYLFVRLESVIKTESGEEVFELSTPSKILANKPGIIDSMYYMHTGKIGKRIIKNVSTIELTCTEIRKSRDEYNPNSSHDGFIFTGPKDRIYSVQYPVAHYGQMSDYGDYITHICEENVTPEELADPEVSKIFDEYILFSYLMKIVYDGIEKSRDKEDQISKAEYRDSNNFDKVISSIEINYNDDVRKFFSFLLSVIPNEWKLVISKDNVFLDDSKVDPFYFTNFNFEKK